MNLPYFYSTTESNIAILEHTLSNSVAETTHLLAKIANLNAEMVEVKARLKQARTDKATERVERYLRVRTTYENSIKEHKAEVSGFKYLSMLTVEQITKLKNFLDYTDNTNRDYVSETLGTAIKVGTFAEDSPEWHFARANGIGGSDISIIMGISPFSTREALLKMKTGEVVQKSNNSGGAALRGHIWEEYIARKFADANRDKKVLFTKDSWHKEGDVFHKANFDGLICEDGSNVPNAILEIKTSSKPEDWENGVPEHYRLQVLWYMDACGFDKGYVAVMINDSDYREYEVVAKAGEMDAIQEAVDLFTAEVSTRKAELALAA